MPDTHYLAVFGDIHGRIALMYTLTRLWERHTARQITAILQVGDMGAFPDLRRLDQATRKYATHDPDELGFHQFYTRTPESVRYFEGAALPRTFFIRGNHDDFAYLSQFAQPTAVDPWSNLWFIPDGQTVTMDAPHLQVGGFGGIQPVAAERKRGKTARQIYRRKAKLAATEPRFFSPDEINAAFDTTGHLDILLTHAGPACAAFPDGSALLTQLAERVRPRVHCFGHHHAVVGPAEGPGQSLLIGLEHLEFQPDHTLREGAWGILTIDDQSASFAFMSPAQAPWLHAIRRETYRQLWETRIEP
jgi:Icc-related predicted phosphoesterase